MMDHPTVSALQSNSDSNFSLARALVLLVGLVALLGLLYLTQSSQATLTGTRAMELQARLERLRRENAQLEYEIAVLTAPDKLAERARRLGLRPATITQTMYIVVHDYPVLPSKPASFARTPSAPPPPADPLPVLWNEWLTRLGWLASGRIVEASP